MRLTNDVKNKVPTIRKGHPQTSPFRPVAASSNMQYSSKAWPQLHFSLSGKVIGTKGEEV